MDLDEPFLGAAQIAEIANTDIVNIHTWTTRRFIDPYHSHPRVHRGGGRVRSYSARDALQFFLMARLHSQYRTPLPQGARICQSVFGEENFNPNRMGYLVLEDGPSGSGEVRWFENLKTLDQHLSDAPVSLVINVQNIMQRVKSAAHQFQALSGQKSSGR